MSKINTEDQSESEKGGYLFPCAGKAFSKLQLQAGDDAGEVAWMEVGSDLDLYASHTHFIQMAAKLRDAAW